MAGTDQTRLLHFARELQRAVNFSEMLEIVRDAIESMTGYHHVWLGMLEPNQTHVRILGSAHFLAEDALSPSQREVVADVSAGARGDRCQRAPRHTPTALAPTVSGERERRVEYGIVQQHGGLMHAYSEVGVGSTFKVYLPAYDRSATTIGPKLSSSVKGGSERILVAEDNRQVQSVLQRILARAGYQVTTVDDGALAVEAVKNGGRFDAIILDAMMPNLGGQKAYEQLRVLAPKAAFLFSSGYAADPYPTTVLSEQGVDLLQKPYDPDLLLRVVRRALDRPPPRD